MAKAAVHKVDWIEIEGRFRAGIDTLRTIADDHAISEGAIRARAKKNGWIRNATQTKRQMVADRMAGVTSDVAQNVKRKIEEAAEIDAADMQMGLDIYRNVLVSMKIASETILDPQSAKVITEATDKAIMGIRKIRGLDENRNMGGTLETLVASAGTINVQVNHG